MEINLRKANALQLELATLAKQLEQQLKLTVSLNEFSVVNEAVPAARAELKAKAENLNKVIEATYVIRDLLGQANASSGINSLLCKAALIDKKIALSTKLNLAEEQKDTRQLNGQINKLANQSETNYYGRTNEVQTGILTSEDKADIKAALSALKKDKLALQDKLLALNIENKIKLDAEVVKILQQADLV